MHKGISMKRAINRGGGQNKLNFPFILKLKQQFQRFRLKKRLLRHYAQTFPQCANLAFCFQSKIKSFGNLAEKIP